MDYNIYESNEKHKHLAVKAVGITSFALIRRR